MSLPSLETFDMYLLAPLVEQVALAEWRNSPACGPEEVAAAIWSNMTSNWEQYEYQEEGLIRQMARRAARAYCQQRRIDYMHSTGAYVYTNKMVRGLLEVTVFCSPEQATDVDARADIMEALKRLPMPQCYAIFRRYALGFPSNPGAEQTAESRGITAITTRLNTGLRL